jgi:hypothetical protein
LVLNSYFVGNFNSFNDEVHNSLKLNLVWFIFIIIVISKVN